MAEASVAFALGLETVTSVLEIDLGVSETILTGDIDAVVLAGTTARLVAPARLINNLHVRGTLKNDPHGVVNANGFDIHTHDGGVVDLRGVEKTAWTGWGGHRFLGDPVVPVVGWEPGDRLVVAPTKETFNAGGVPNGVFAATEMTWTGNWVSMVRPANSPDVLLLDGRTALPEVINLSQSFTIENADRIMMHESDVPNVHTFKWIRVLNAGKSFAQAGELGHYPIHFHMLGDTARGSLVEGVVVEGGKNHAFVPHASHGITFRGCVAYNTQEHAYWWDPPPSQTDTTNDTDDIVFERCLAGKVSPTPGTANTRLTAFHFGRGMDNVCTDSAAFGVLGGKNSSGFLWPEGAGAKWVMDRNVAHNNISNGIFVWQNSGLLHDINDFVAYRNGKSQIEQGAYTNSYQYRRLVLMGGTGSLKLHARSTLIRPMLFEDVVTDSPLQITLHQASAEAFVVFRRWDVPSVVYDELGNNGTEFSWLRYEDCGLVPADFTLTTIHPNSIIEITEGGVLAHRWAGGWT